MKNDIRDRLTDAFGIPEPVRKEEFFSTLEESQKKRSILPIIMRVGSVAAAAAAAAAIWIAGRTTPEMIIDHHNDPIIVEKTEYTTENGTSAEDDTIKPTKENEKPVTVPEPTEADTSENDYNKPVTGTALPTVPSDTAALTSAAQNDSSNSQATAAAQPSGTSPSAPGTKPAHAAETSDGRPVTTAKVTTGKSERITTAVIQTPTKPSSTKAVTEPVKTTPVTTSKPDKPVDSPADSTPAPAETLPPSQNPQPAYTRPVQTPTEDPRVELPEEPTGETPTHEAEPNPVYTEVPTIAPTDCPTMPAPITEDPGEKSLHNGDYYYVPYDTIDMPVNFILESDIYGYGREETDYMGFKRYDYLENHLSSYVFIGRVDQVYATPTLEQDKYAIVENVTILTPLHGECKQGDKCSITSSAFESLSPSDQKYELLRSNYPDSPLLDYYQNHWYTGPDDLYWLYDNTIRRIPLKGDICLFFVEDGSQNPFSNKNTLSYYTGTQESRYTLRDGIFQNDFYSNYRFSINTILDYFDDFNY